MTDDQTGLAETAIALYVAIVILSLYLYFVIRKNKHLNINNMPHTILSHFFENIGHLFTKAIKPALIFAYDFVNVVKANEATIETIATVINAKLAAEAIPVFETWLGATLRVLRFATIESDKTLDEVIKDAQDYLNQLSGSARAVQLNSLAALVATWYADHTGESMSIQDALSAVQTVYHKEGNI